MKRTRSKAATAAEKRHMERVAALGCCVCGGEATVHHVTSDGYQRLSRLHSRVIPLCPHHHLIQHGPWDSIEALGHAGFRAAYDIYPLGRAELLWLESEQLERKAA